MPGRHRHPLAAALELLDRREARTRQVDIVADQQRIGPIATVELVGHRGLARHDEDIVAGIAVQRIDAGTALDPVGPAAATDRVVAVATVEHLGPVGAGDLVVAAQTRHLVGLQLGRRPVGAQHIVAGRASAVA